MSRRPPTGPITTVYSVIGPTGTGDMVIGIELAPLEIAKALYGGVTIVDVRAITTGSGSFLRPDGPKRELEWLITLLGGCGEQADHYQAMEEARQALRDDMDNGRVLPGTHPGRPTAEPELPLEAALREFRERTMRELEKKWRKQEEKRRAEQLRSIRRAGRRRMWRLGR